MESTRTPNPFAFGSQSKKDTTTNSPTSTGAREKSNTKVAPNFGDLSDLVTFVIGQSKQEFMIHKAFVCHYSPVLKAAFSSAFIEGQTQTYILEDTTEVAFKLFSEWIYTQRLEDDGDHSFGITFASLSQLWILAEKLLIPKLQNLAINLIETLRIHRNVIGIGSFKPVYDSTASNCALRRLLVHMCVWNFSPQDLKTYERWFPKEMLVDIAVLSGENLLKKATYSRNMTDFHVKEDDEN